MGIFVKHEAKSFKITVMTERRPDGGLRLWSDDVPGLVLSHRDPSKVLADLVPALEMILSEKMGCAVKAQMLVEPPFAAHRPRPSLGKRTEQMARRYFDRLGTSPRNIEIAASICA